MQVQHRSSATGRALVVEMWADLGCPWCYLGRHRLQRAIDARPDSARFALRLRSFELHPGAPHEPETIASAFMRSHGGDPERVLDAERQMRALARSEGLAFSLGRLNANTFDVHRVLHLANAEGRGLAFFSLLQDGFFSGELNPFDQEELAAAAASAGIPADRVRAVLTSDAYADAVRADRQEGLALGVRGVPFVVLDRRLGVAGAQSIDGYGEALAQAIELVDDETPEV